MSTGVPKTVYLRSSTAEASKSGGGWWMQIWCASDGKAYVSEPENKFTLRSYSITRCHRSLGEDQSILAIQVLFGVIYMNQSRGKKACRRLSHPRAVRNPIPESLGAVSTGWAESLQADGILLSGPVSRTCVDHHLFSRARRRRPYDGRTT